MEEILVHFSSLTLSLSEYGLLLFIFYTCPLYSSTEAGINLPYYPEVINANDHLSVSYLL